MRPIDANELMESIRKALGIKSMAKSLLLPVERTIIDQIDSAPTVGGWISVKDRLPEDAGIYIICDHYGNVMSRHFCKKSDKFAGYWHANGSKFYGNPTHWMPLPEPQKEEEHAAD